MKKIMIFALVLLITSITTSCDMNNNGEEKPIKKEDMDLTASPVEDFNQYANGGWMKSHPIPADKSRHGAFTELADKNEKKLKAIVEEMSGANAEPGSVERKIEDMFATGMDTAAIEKAGAEPLKPYIEQIESIASVEDMQALLAEYKTQGMGFLFGFYGSPDKINSDFQIPQLSQSGLGLPDRSYYFDKGEDAENIREKYLNHVQTMLELAGADSDEASKAAEKIMDIETRLAKASLTREQLRDVKLTYNKMPLSEVDALMDNFDWKTYFKSVGLAEPGEINVGMPDFFEELDNMLAEVDIKDWQWYLKWHMIDKNASFLSKDFVNQNFAFYGKTLSGQEQIRPRWKRVLNATNGVLSEAIGKVYVNKYFPPEAKERMEKLVGNLKLALAERIKVLPWMGDSTKTLALEKLNTIKVKVGYPDKWKDYSTLDIKDDNYLANIMRARKWNYKDMLSKINKPVDKSEWFMPPQMVNAYYNPAYNEIVFPAGILQPPFFYQNGDDAVNYGAIGMVIGHEMTHGFDDKGRLYDKNGNMTDWWTKDDAERFNERSQKLVEQYNNVNIIDTIMANGELSLGENIADLGGLNISLTALKNTEQYKNGKEIDGFTPLQRFFLAYAHVWAQNIRDKEKVRLTKVDVHSLGRNRVNEPLRNMPEFHKAFGAKQGDYMFLSEEQRAYIW
ncbi:Neutral endopeptidase [Salinivirga cyanobacteriivorans]|uniref:Neutral endopeptidase n=1 Tax=Salinivirga cyanobacteriivorans TaxID=1307839 RepID=A0A0S2HXK3_9BACT|nr:M13 family metallopeptidase [Salinivirga cyanobacteriivorans]ALO14754.1 Neutral endopeptidase [Salinivirga cyanobacteriivorans]